MIQYRYVVATVPVPVVLLPPVRGVFSIVLFHQLSQLPSSHSSISFQLFRPSLCGLKLPSAGNGFFKKIHIYLLKKDPVQTRDVPQQQSAALYPLLTRFPAAQDTPTPPISPPIEWENILKMIKMRWMLTASSCSHAGAVGGRPADASMAAAHGHMPRVAFTNVYAT
jgi:hypothetical protein